jgi:phenylpropionate dioxygenase-like ring-hydroxylating dioxygenase large terminal subunit
MFVLTNHWYAVAFSSAVTSKPTRMSVFGDALVVYRRLEDRRVVALSDACAHRGAALSRGWLDGDCIRCPYHGWKYDIGGGCVEIPANPADTPVPSNARVRAYAAEERYGLVWLFRGDLPEHLRPAIPTLKHFDDPAMRLVSGSFGWRAHYTHVEENSIDISHLPWVHDRSIGHLNPSTVEFHDVREEEWGASATIVREISPGKKWLWSYLERKSRHSGCITVTASFHMPNVTCVEVSLPFATFCVYGAHVPVDDRTTVTRWISLRSFLMGWWADRATVRRTLRVYEEDRAVVESQHYAPGDVESHGNVHVKSDFLQIAFRRLRKKSLESNLSYYKAREAVKC